MIVTRSPGLVRGALAAVTAAWLLVGTGVASGDSGADEADVRFDRGNAHYKAGRYEEALAEFFASNRLAPNRNVVFNIARSYEALKRYEQAYRYYAEYSGAEIDSKERGAAEKKLRQLAPLVALVRIDSDPPGATVYIDRKDLGGRGQTPLLIAHRPGEHDVILQLDGFRPVTVRTQLVRGEERKVTARLALIVGTVRIQSTPSARVFVDRAEGDSRPPHAAGTPTTLELTPGRHTLELQADGYRSRRSDVVVRANQLTQIEVAMEARPPPSGTVVLASSVQGALVVVDGVERGFTPAVLSLVTGSHAIEVRGEGYKPWQRTVAVDRDGRQFFQVELSQLEREVVGATKSQQSISSAPAAISLVTRDEMWAFGHQKLTEALRSVRGFYDSDDRNYESLGIRGFSRPGDYTNRILLMRDGHPINDDWIGSAPVGRDFAVDLEDVSRIEVVRGPGSTFYGPGAFFGVVNAVSDAPGEGPPVRAGGTLTSDGGGGAFAHGSSSYGPVALSIHASAWDSTGRTLRFGEFADTPSGGVVARADAEDAQRGAVRVRAGELAFDAGYNRRSKDIPTASFETVFNPADNPLTAGVLEHTIDRRGFAEARWDHARERMRVAARLAYDYQQYDGTYPYEEEGEGFIVTDAGGGDWVTGELRTSFQFADQWLTLGGEAAGHRVAQSVDEDNDGEDEFDDRQDFVNASIYALDELSLGDRLAITAGARFDRFGEQRDTALSPRVGVVARPYGDAVSKLVVGRAFRPPSVFELYYNDGGITQIAPESLDPETIWSGELEHTHPIGQSSFLLASVFASRIDSLIKLGTTMDDILIFENSSDDVRSVGGELEARVGTDNGAWTSAAMSYAYLASDDDAAEVNSAELVAALRGLWPISSDRLVLASELVYNSPRRRRDGSQTGHALLGSVFLSGRLAVSQLHFRAGVTNVLDWDWSAAVGEELVQQQIPQAPRTFIGQLVYRY